jgi:hypothetical protein
VALEEWLTEAETAAEIGKTVRTLRQWRRKGLGPPYALFGRTVKYNRSVLIEYYKSQQVIPAQTRKRREPRS